MGHVARYRMAAAAGHSEMGVIMPGPRPTPTKILKARGSWRAGSRGGEPVPDPSLPKKPPFVTGKAALYWKRTSALLAGMGVLTSIDGMALAIYCVYLDKWVVEITKDKEIPQYLSDQKMYLKEIHHGEKSFGLSPADRAGIIVGTQQADDGLGKYFKVG